MPRIVSPFDVVGWDPSPIGEADAGPVHSRAIVRKKFHGELDGESTAELLMCQADTADLSAGAGYVASERVAGVLSGRKGTFVMQHWGLSGAEGAKTGGHVVWGSGTGELEGLRGRVEIAVDQDGKHTIALDYELP